MLEKLASFSLGSLCASKGATKTFSLEFEEVSESYDVQSDTLWR